LINSPPDTDLIIRLQRGDIEAFDLLYERYASKLYYFGIKYLKSPEEAEEMVQTVFLKVWENLKSLKTELSFKSYLFTIAYSDICKVFRGRFYWKKFTENSIRENVQFSESSEIEDNIGFNQVFERIQHIVSKLPEKQRSVFMQSKIEGKSAREIAMDLKLSPGTVDNYISEVLKYIRSHIHNEDFALLLFFSILLP